MSGALGPLSLIADVGGQIAGGISGLNAGRAGARVDRENARLTLLQGEQQALQTRKDERMVAGDMIASLAGAGVELGTGTAGDVLAQSAYQRELEILQIRTRATYEANNLYQSAADKRAAGTSALLQGVFGGVSSALKGVSDLRAQRTLSGQQAKERTSRLGGGTQAQHVKSTANIVPQMRVKGTL